VLEKLFRVRESGSTPGREAMGGLATFLTMVYILFVNPVFLTAAGIPREGAIVATGLGAAVGTLVMAFAANYPIALAPGMGLNAFFAFGICKGAGVPWQTALGLVFWSGVIVLVLTVTRARNVIVAGVPPVIRFASAIGIGLFIAFIGLQQGGIVAAHPHTMVTMAPMSTRPALITLIALAATLGLMAARVRTAIFWGMAVALVLGLISGALERPAAVVAVPRLSLPGFEIDLWGALKPRYLPLLLVLLFFTLFDALGTLMGVAHAGGFLRDGQLPRLTRAMTADAVGTSAGALFGTSTVTCYIESGTGVAVGARTGLANVVTGALFLVAIFFTPLVAVVGKGMEGGFNPVTAPALIAVGTLMIGAVREIRWDDATEATPAFLTFLLMPLTFSISHGLAIGIVAYVLVKAAAGRAKEVPWLMYGLAAAFLLRYALLPV
jgi:adenine/guanine/hypoxanthine permease